VGTLAGMSAADTTNQDHSSETERPQDGATFLGDIEVAALPFATVKLVISRDVHDRATPSLYSPDAYPTSDGHTGVTDQIHTSIPDEGVQS
jgi:hypothetical protein